MLLPQTYLQCVLLALFGVSCLALWAYGWRLTPGWHVAVFNLDFAIGALTVALVLGATLGVDGMDGFDVIDDIRQAGKIRVITALACGAFLSAANVLLVRALRVTGMMTAWSIAAGCGIPLGAVAPIVLTPDAGGILVGIGALCCLLAGAMAALSFYLGSLRQPHVGSWSSFHEGATFAGGSGLCLGFALLTLRSFRLGETTIGPFASIVLLTVAMLICSPVAWMAFPVIRQGKLVAPIPGVRLSRTQTIPADEADSRHKPGHTQGDSVAAGRNAFSVPAPHNSTDANAAGAGRQSWVPGSAAGDSFGAAAFAVAHEQSISSGFLKSENVSALGVKPAGPASGQPNPAPTAESDVAQASFPAWAFAPTPDEKLLVAFFGPDKLASLHVRPAAATSAAPESGSAAGSPVETLLDPTHVPAGGQPPVAAPEEISQVGPERTGRVPVPPVEPRLDAGQALRPGGTEATACGPAADSAPPTVASLAETTFGPAPDEKLPAALLGLHSSSTLRGKPAGTTPGPPDSALLPEPADQVGPAPPSAQAFAPAPDERLLAAFFGPERLLSHRGRAVAPDPGPANSPLHEESVPALEQPSFPLAPDPKPKPGRVLSGSGSLPASRQDASRAATADEAHLDPSAASSETHAGRHSAAPDEVLRANMFGREKGPALRVRVEPALPGSTPTAPEATASNPDEIMRAQIFGHDRAAGSQPVPTSSSGTAPIPVGLSEDSAAENQPAPGKEAAPVPVPVDPESRHEAAPHPVEVAEDIAGNLPAPTTISLPALGLRQSRGGAVPPPLPSEGTDPTSERGEETTTNQSQAPPPTFAPVPDEAVMTAIFGRGRAPARRGKGPALEPEPGRPEPAPIGADGPTPSPAAPALAPDEAVLSALFGSAPRRRTRDAGHDPDPGEPDRRTAPSHPTGTQGLFGIQSQLPWNRKPGNLDADAPGSAGGVADVRQPTRHSQRPANVARPAKYSPTPALRPSLLLGPLRNRLLGLVAGVIWAAGMVTIFVATHPTAPVKLGERDALAILFLIPLLASLWGLAAYPEARPTVRSARLATACTLLLQILGILMITSRS